MVRFDLRFTHLLSPSTAMTSTQRLVDGDANRPSSPSTNWANPPPPPSPVLTSNTKPTATTTASMTPLHTNPLFGNTTDLQTVSKRVALKKVAKFEKNISKRGSTITSVSKKGFLILFMVLVVASFIFQIVRMALHDGGDQVKDGVDCQKLPLCCRNFC